MLDQLIRNTRSYRRFEQEVAIGRTTLMELVNLGRLGGSARNLQPLRYKISNEPATNDLIFPHLGWAGYLKDWPGPEEGERPSAYIVCMLDTRLAKAADCDLGIATQNILLGATTHGLGGCRIASFSPKLRDVLHIPGHLHLLMVVALGKPKERVVLDELEEGGDIRYWRDREAAHHVPKRTLADIVIE